MSDDYTPTTEEVRDRWGRDLISEEWHDSWADEFDRWLAEVQRAAEERGYKRGWMEHAARLSDTIREGHGRHTNQCPIS